MPKPSPLVIKIGGSIITDKHSGRPTFIRSQARRLARELRQVRQPCILLHGAGSFGHPLVHRYRLLGQPITPKRLFGVAATMLSVRTLSNALTAVCHAAGLPVVPFQTSNLATVRKGRLFLPHLETVAAVLSRGGIPLLSGDIMIADEGKSAIVSADALAVALARRFRARRVLFLTDVPGVFPSWPPTRGSLPIATLSRLPLRTLTTTRTAPHPRDVTGGMIGKLRALLRLRHCTVTIMDGRRTSLLRRVLRGERIGTTITFS